jgi:cytochrome P450
VTFHPPAPPRQPDDQSSLMTLHHMRRCPITALRERSYRLKMGRVNLITRSIWLINDTKLVRQILSDQSDRYPKGVMMGHVLGLLVNQSSFISNGEIWRRRRRMMDKAFEQAGLKRVFPLMRETTDDMLTRLGEAAGQGPVTLDVEMAHVTADIIFRTVFSKPLQRHEAENLFEAFQRFQREMFRYGQAAIMRLPRFLSYFTLKRAAKAAADIRGMLDPKIKARMEAVARGEASGENDILGTLISVEDPETGTRFSYEELCEEVATLMLAGHETSSSTLAWSLYLLARAPEIQDRARAEVMSVLGERRPEFQDMKRLGLVRNIFREALRLYPPVPFMTRDLAQAETMRGHRLKRNTILYISPWILHRSDVHWQDPDGFDPDRFDRPETTEAQRFAYLPFSQGPRVCLGASFAMQESTLILAELLRHFAFLPTDDPDPVPRMRLSLRPDRPIRLRLRPARAPAPQGMS